MPIAPPAAAAVASPPPVPAGGGEASSGGVGLTWADRHIARRNAARAILAGLGMTPQREQSEMATSLPSWKVPGWTGAFDDHELIALAERMEKGGRRG
ncbi:MAG: hypothetical protein ACXW27_08965 [Allosphingosinicella sp.]